MHSSFLPTFAVTALSQSPAPGASPVRAFGNAGPRLSLAQSQSQSQSLTLSRPLPLLDPQGWQ